MVFLCHLINCIKRRWQWNLKPNRKLQENAFILKYFKTLWKRNFRGAGVVRRKEVAQVETGKCIYGGEGGREREGDIILYQREARKSCLITGVIESPGPRPRGTERGERRDVPITAPSNVGLFFFKGAFSTTFSLPYPVERSRNWIFGEVSLKWNILHIPG